MCVSWNDVKFFFINFKIAMQARCCMSIAIIVINVFVNVIKCKNAKMYKSNIFIV